MFNSSEMSDEAQPRVSEFMTPLPVTVEVGMYLTDALDRMYSDNIRHLPVVNDDGALVGMLSTRDIAAAAALHGVNPKKATVETAMAAVPYACAEDLPLAEVVRKMEHDRLGSAIVTRGAKPVGIFTTTDALRVLRAHLTGEEAKPLVHPEITQGEGETERPAVRPRRGGTKPRASDSMVSWFLTKF